LKTLLAIDGNSLFHRAYHAYGPRDGASGETDDQGRPSWGVSGFLNLLSGVLERVKPSAVVVGFDDPEDSVRRDAYPAYKATRGERDEDLRTQLARTRELTAALGLAVSMPAGLEADDVVASAAELARKSGWRCVIATSDRDAFAQVDETTVVMRLVNGGVKEAVKVDDEYLLEKYGVKGSQYLDFSALRGDKSDNLPGVNGIGDKTAAKLLKAMGSAEAAFADIEAVEEPGAKVVAAVGRGFAAKLSVDGAREAFVLNRSIMGVVSSVDLGDVLTRGPVHDARGVQDTCRAHGVRASARLVATTSSGGAPARSASSVPAYRRSSAPSPRSQPAPAAQAALDLPIPEAPPLEDRGAQGPSRMTSHAQASPSGNPLAATLIPNPRPVTSTLLT
jgi:DNA polymerase-1